MSKDKDKPTIRERIKQWVNIHRDASDEALALLAALRKALLDRRISTLERAEIVRKAEALIRALNSAPEEE
jgi:hypothetical protein